MDWNGFWSFTILFFFKQPFSVPSFNPCVLDIITLSHFLLYHIILAFVWYFWFLSSPNVHAVINMPRFLQYEQPLLWDVVLARAAFFSKWLDSVWSDATGNFIFFSFLFPARNTTTVLNPSTKHICYMFLAAIKKIYI